MCLFFELHTDCDIEHGIEILECCKEEATNPQPEKELDLAQSVH